MKKAAYGLLAAFLAMGACGDLPQTAELWYQPPNGFTEQTAVGEIYYVDAGTSKEMRLPVSVNDKGELVSDADFETQDMALQSAYGALRAALKAEANNKRQDEALKTLGENLFRVFREDGISIRGIDPNGVTREYTLSFVSGRGLGSEAGAQVEDPTMSYKISDEKSLRWKQDNKMEISGWSSAGPSLNLSAATSNTRTDLDVYDIPVRYNHGRGGALEDTVSYIRIDRISGIPPDDVSIVTNRDTGGAYFDNQLSIAGVKDAEDGWVFYKKYKPEGGRDGVPAWSEPGGLWNGASVRWWRDEDCAMYRADLAGWTNSAPGETDVDIGALLTDNEWKDEREKYLVVARYQEEGESPTLRYLPFGDTIGGIVWATNWTESIKRIAADEAEKIVNWNTNWVILAESIASSKEATEKYVSDTLNWTTNWYASTEQLNTSADDVRDYINGQLDILTNMIAGINGVIESGDFDTVQTVREYVQEVMNIQTNEMMAIVTALDEGVVESTAELIDYKYDILTNMIAGINGVIESGIADIDSVRSYVGEVIDIQTNFITNAEFAKMSGVVDSTKELVDYNFDILTNQIAGIKEIIENGDIETIETVSDYIERVIELQKNFVPVENWTYVTNYIYNYFGGDGRTDEGKPLIAPEDDPYSGEYESKPMTDSLLPVKNALMMVAVTNEPLSAIEARHLLDFESVNTNDDLRVQLAGFDKASTDQMPVKKGAAGGGYTLEWLDFPEDLLTITTNGISEIKNWMVQHNVTNIFKTVVSNADVLVGMSTNLFGYVKAEGALDNDTIWTNGSGRVEMKGFETAPMYAVPFIDYNQAIAEQGKDRGMTWQKLPFADSDLSRFGVATTKQTIEAEEIRSLDNNQLFQTFSLFGFGDADEGSVPVKKTNQSHVSYLSWEKLRALKFIGTDQSEVVIGSGGVTNEVVFASENDSNVTVKCTPYGDGNVQIKLGVYWK